MRTLLGWELGDNLGHLMRLLPLARALRGRGDEVVWAMSGGRRSALDRIGAEGFLAVPVPDWDCVDPALPWSQTYGQNLLRNGYRLPHRLAAQLEAWRVLIADQKPDLLIAEHAPTALLAARRAGLPRLALGTGFSLPPRSRPMPGLPPWFTFPQDLLVRHEESFLERVNPVLEAAGCRPLGQAADIFEGAVPCLCTWPEFDHYPDRPPKEYHGPLFHPAWGRAPRWAGDPMVFVYLKANHRLFGDLLDLLRKHRLPALVYAPDHDGGAGRPGDGIRITSQPVDLCAAKDRVRFAITAGGHNTAVRMLREGIPMLLCPAQLEQAVLAFRLAERGLCAMVSMFDPAPDLTRPIQALAEEPAPPALLDLAHRYRDWDPARTLDSILDRCLEVIA